MKILFGYDTETYKGPPISQQIWNPNYYEMRWVDNFTIFSDFLDFLDELPNNGHEYIFYALNLEFDIRSLFYDHLGELAQESFRFFEREYTISGVYAGVCFAKFTHASKRKTVWLVDISAFFGGSLDSLAAVHCPHIRKMDKPEGLGNKRFTAADKSFIDYSMRDAEICFHIGKNINELHDRYEISQGVSAPQMAGKIFRTHFLRQTIPNPPAAITHAAWNTYHGGKNGFYTSPGIIRDCIGLDLVSAYTWAMSCLPSFYDKKKYKTFQGSKAISSVPEFGIYRISGRAVNCKYPILFKKSSGPSKRWMPLSGKIENLWVTGFELNEAIRSSEFILKNVFGYFFDAGTEDFEKSPFRQFALTFFEKKDTADNEIDRTFYKLITNALYGKLCETRKERSYYDLKEEKQHTGESVEPGPLFFPMASTSITGMIRAKIHEIEHKYQALHTSTDGIICKKENVDISRLHGGLGGLKIECEGDVLFFRNKMYIVYNKTPQKNSIKSTIFNDKYIVKYAHHAYHGSIEKLESMYLNSAKLNDRDRWKYEHTHVNKVKESKRSNLIVNDFVIRKSSLKGIKFLEE